MIGTVAKAQVPLFFSFDEEEVEYVAETLANALQQSYQIIDMFQFSEEDYE